MRLPDFIIANLEQILEEWESFARSIWPGPVASRRVLRDHAEDMLLAVARDMKSSQTQAQQSEKSKGLGQGGPNQRGKNSDRVDDASNLHAVSRLSSGFDVRTLVAEFRALRASVIHLWASSSPDSTSLEMQDVIRFNEAIDQQLAESLATFARCVDASRDCFIANLGHDLRNPLAASTMNAYLLAESTTLDSRASKMAATLCSSLDAMDCLIRDLLDFTGTRMGTRMGVLAQPMDLVDLCREVIGEMQAAHPGHLFELKCPENGDTTGEWDAMRLRQLIWNLLGNAVQHGSSLTPVNLTVIAEGESVNLAVRNFGPPIPEDLISSIFDPMKRQLEAISTSRHGSVGLGLYVAREVASAHGGTIKVASVDEETIFTVHLPRRHFLCETLHKDRNHSDLQ
ncbi:MAG: HAMP domain-containing histidine kinase [Armatimonadetes bacterium]|nr:HAMP domain-containing histidine kinase [Akkermansiaceae bacterium]